MSLNNRKNSTKIVLGVAILFLGIMAVQFFTRKSPTAYARQLTTERVQKNGEFRTSANSPIIEDKRRTFNGLKYFQPDEAYIAKARLEQLGGGDTIILGTTQGTNRKLLKAGTLIFNLQEREQRLSAFRYLDGPRNTLFIPFKDISSGKTTYGGGRYLETVVEPGKTIELDFNRAYNPYCVYNDAFVCPLPPLENKLRVEVLAGEKAYEE
ncbi:MAG: DUF1684 domain-containing protein [Bacteroidia bacterium]